MNAVNNENEFNKYFKRWITSTVDITHLLFRTRKYEIAKSIFSEIYDQYQNRPYHNLKHVSDCLDYLENLFVGPCMFYPLRPPKSLVMAVWLHDVIYDPKRSDNEWRSAVFAMDILRKLQLMSIADKVVELILATKHSSKNFVHKKIVSKEEIDLMLDIDLAILGQNKERFDEYERGIRQEYVHVPEDVFREKRAEILQGFLDRPRIFRTNYFHNKYEDQARENLKRSIKRLTGN